MHIHLVAVVLNMPVTKWMSPNWHDLVVGFLITSLTTPRYLLLHVRHIYSLSLNSRMKSLKKSPCGRVSRPNTIILFTFSKRKHVFSYSNGSKPLATPHIRQKHAPSQKVAPSLPWGYIVCRSVFYFEYWSKLQCSYCTPTSNGKV